MSPHPPLRVGLTGGIASGKSTVAALFATRGIPVIDTDRLAREVVAPGSEGLMAVVDAFGPDILTAEGELDRAALGRRVFHSPQERQTLEGLLHPRIQERLDAIIGNLHAPYVVVMVPLLVETGMDRDMDTVLVVDLPEAMQREQLTVRDGLSEAEADARLAAQATRQQRLDAADYIIDNSGARERLAGQVADLHRRLLAQSRDARP
ncbi:MAG: dephospho-CoA kinase [Halorhodospira sp.]